MNTYAIISVAGKQFRVSEGQRLLVDRLPTEEGGTFKPPVLLVGGDGGPLISPDGVTVTVRVVDNRRGPKIRIGKYKKRTGYRRHTGFRAALTQIEIESITGVGGPKKKAEPARPEAAKPKAKEKKLEAPEPTEAAPAAEPQATGEGALPDGYADLTIAQLKGAAQDWDAEGLRAALEYEQSRSNRKGAIAALESAIAKKEDT